MILCVAYTIQKLPMISDFSGGQSRQGYVANTKTKSDPFFFFSI